MKSRQAFFACLQRSPPALFEAALWIAAEHDATVLRSYRKAFNGFATTVTARKARQLGMTRTTFDALEAARGDYAFGYRLDEGQWSRERIEPDGEVGAMGGLATTVPDWARYIAFLLGAWPARDDPDSGPVRRASVREMVLWHAPPFPNEPVNGQVTPPSAYGYGLMSTADRDLGRRAPGDVGAAQSDRRLRLCGTGAAGRRRSEAAGCDGDGVDHPGRPAQFGC